MVVTSEALIDHQKPAIDCVFYSTVTSPALLIAKPISSLIIYKTSSSSAQNFINANSLNIIN